MIFKGLITLKSAVLFCLSLLFFVTSAMTPSPDRNTSSLHVAGMQQAKDVWETVQAGASLHCHHVSRGNQGWLASHTDVRQDNKNSWSSVFGTFWKSLTPECLQSLSVCSHSEAGSSCSRARKQDKWLFFVCRCSFAWADFGRNIRVWNQKNQRGGASFLQLLFSLKHTSSAEHLHSWTFFLFSIKWNEVAAPLHCAHVWSRTLEKNVHQNIHMQQKSAGAEDINDLFFLKTHKAAWWRSVRAVRGETVTPHKWSGGSPACTRVLWAPGGGKAGRTEDEEGMLDDEEVGEHPLRPVHQTWAALITYKNLLDV